MESPAGYTSTSTVLVLGANGRFGLAATRAFAAAGWRVLAQVRRETWPAFRPVSSWYARR